MKVWKGEAPQRCISVKLDGIQAMLNERGAAYILLTNQKEAGGCSSSGFPSLETASTQRAFSCSPGNGFEGSVKSGKVGSWPTRCTGGHSQEENRELPTG